MDTGLKSCMSPACFSKTMSTRHLRASLCRFQPCLGSFQARYAPSYTLCMASVKVISATLAEACCMYTAVGMARSRVCHALRSDLL